MVTQQPEQQLMEHQVVYHLLFSSLDGSTGGILSVFPARELSVR